MKFTPGLLALLALVVSDVAAQEVTPAPVCPDGPCSGAVGGVPACATGCIATAASSAGCREADLECRCASSAVIQGAAAGCVIGNCANLLEVINAVGSVCACVGSNPGTYCGSPSTSEPPTSEPTSEPEPPTTTEPTSPTSEPPSSTQPDISVPTGASSEPTSPSSPPSNTSPTSKPPGTTTCVTTKADCAPVASTAVPSCAQACFTSAAPKVNCGATDFACQCQPEAQSSLTQLLLPCVATACEAAQLPSVIAGASSVCACATAAPKVDCGGNGGGGGSSKPPTTGSPYPTTTKDHTTGGGSTDGGGSTCKAGTTSDCGPVASSAVPHCAQACFSSAAPKVGCDVTDYGCQCKPAAQASLSQLLIPCVATACEAAQLPSVIAGAEEVCSCASAPPSGGDCSGNGGGGPKPTPTPTNGGGGGGHGGGHSSGGHHTSGGGGGGHGNGPSMTCVAVTMTPSPAQSGGEGGAADCAPLASSIQGCAQPCFSSAIPRVGCKIDDYPCQCQSNHQASLSRLLIPCVATACQAAVLPSIIAEADAVCKCAATAGAGGGKQDNPEPITTTTCYTVGGEHSGGGGGGGGGNVPTATGGGGSGGGGSGEQTTGNGGSGATQTGSEPPASVPTAGANTKFEMGVVGAIFGAAWIAAVAL